MKKVFAVLAALVIAGPAFAQSSVFPHDDYWRMSGKRLDPAAQSQYTTLDSIDFGFTANAVQLCLHDDSNPVWVRFAATVTTTTASLDRVRAPASTPTAFTDGAAATAHSHGAMPIIASGDGTDVQCVVVPIEARGVVVHVASGLATLDATGFLRRPRR